MPAIRHDALLLRLLKRVEEISAALRRVTVNLPLYDVANENTPAQLTANQNNYVIGNYDILRLNSDRSVIITGFRGGVKGRRLQLFNVGNDNIVLAHQNSGSDAENRFKFKNSTAFLSPGDTLTVYYDFTQQRWIEATQVFQFTLEGWNLHSMPAGTYRDVAWSPSLGLLAAVGSSGLIATSPDGETWTSRTKPRANAVWYAVAWSPDLGLFCAVAGDTTAGSAGNKVMTSPDGIIWTLQTSPESADGDIWHGICWADDLALFVAVGNDIGGTDDIMTSPDGINWTLRTSPSGTSLFWSDVLWADNFSLLVAIQTSSLNPMGASSPNGTNWTARNFPVVANLGEKSLAYSSTLGRVVAVGNLGGNGRLYSSDNGTLWTSRASDNDTGKQWISSAWSDAFRVYLVVDNGGNYAIQSSDGIDWVDTEGAGIGINSLIFVDELGKFVGVGSSQAATIP